MITKAKSALEVILIVTFIFLCLNLSSAYLLKCNEERIGETCALIDTNDFFELDTDQNGAFNYFDSTHGKCILKEDEPFCKCDNIFCTAQTLDPPICNVTINSSLTTDNCTPYYSLGEHKYGDYKLTWQSGVISHIQPKDRTTTPPTLLPREWGSAVHPKEEKGCNNVRGIHYQYTSGHELKDSDWIPVITTTPWPDDFKSQNKEEAEQHYINQKVEFHHKEGEIRIGLIDRLETQNPDNKGLVTLKLEGGDCEPPRIITQLKPDKYQELIMQEWVRYSDVFPINLKCKIHPIVPFLDIEDIEINYTIKSSKRGIIQQEIITTKSNQIKRIPINEEPIIPGEEITCSASFLEDPYNEPPEVFEDNVKIPELDLTIKSIKPINVIQDTKLIRNKPLMVRVFPQINSDLIDEIDQDITIELEYEENTYQKQGRIKTFPDIARLKREPFKTYTDHERGIDLLRQLKLAENSINFFNLNPPETFSHILPIKAKIISQIKENDTTNNEKQIAQQIRAQLEKIKSEITVIYPYYQEGNSHVPFTDEDYIEDSIQTGRQNYEFIKKTYPFDPELVKINKINAKVINLKPPSTEGRPYNLSYVDDIQNKIYRELQKKADKNKIDIIIAVLPRELMLFESDEGIGHVSGLAAPDHFKNILLISENVNINVAAHELGHLNGLCLDEEEYDEFPGLGKLASNGWQLNQETGQSEGQKINIWTEPNNDEEYTTQIVDIPETGGDVQTRIRLSAGRPKYFNIMGSANHAWINKETYEYLIEMYTK